MRPSRRWIPVLIQGGALGADGLLSLPGAHLAQRGAAHRWHGGRILTEPWKRGPLWGFEGPVLAAVSDFYYRRYRDLPGIAIEGAALKQTWRSREGAVGLLQWTQPLAKRTGALSVWRSEEDLTAFLRAPEHTAIMRRWRSRMRGDSIRWLEPKFSPDELWTEAARRLTERLREDLGESLLSKLG